MTKDINNSTKAMSKNVVLMASWPQFDGLDDTRQC